MNKIKKTIFALSMAALTSSFAYAGNGSIAVNTSGFIPPTGVSSNQSVAVGGGSTGASDNGTATGFNTHAGVGGTAYGSNTTADNGATALGANSYAAGTSVVIGSGSTGDGLGGVWGNNSSTGTAQNAWVIGNGITATRSNEVAVGGKTIGQVGTATQADQVTNLGQVNNIATQTLNSANQYTDNVASQTLNAANTYTDTEIAKIKIPAGAKPVAAVDYTNTTSDNLVLNDNNGNGTTISNVANGVKDHDAANMGQLRSVQSQLNGRIDGLQKRVDGVGAMGAAQSNIIYNPYGSRFQLGVGVGMMGSSQAIAVKAMVASPSRHYIYSFGASSATNGGTSVGAGMSFSF
ncbi:YadA-like family protein [Burkholderia cenocepacia]|nr:YadA-like family protein [Burkholderia cenocepacia]MCW5156292.1 YadA-like family protein [Burkholderia cenocepacia]